GGGFGGKAIWTHGELGAYEMGIASKDWYFLASDGSFQNLNKARAENRIKITTESGVSISVPDALGGGKVTATVNQLRVDNKVVDGSSVTAQVLYSLGATGGIMPGSGNFTASDTLAVALKIPVGSILSGAFSATGTLLQASYSFGGVTIVWTTLDGMGFGSIGAQAEGMVGHIYRNENGTNSRTVILTDGTKGRFVDLHATSYASGQIQKNLGGQSGNDLAYNWEGSYIKTEKDGKNNITENVITFYFNESSLTGILSHGLTIDGLATEAGWLNGVGMTGIGFLETDTHVIWKRPGDVVAGWNKTTRKTDLVTFKDGVSASWGRKVTDVGDLLVLGVDIEMRRNGEEGINSGAYTDVYSNGKTGADAQTLFLNNNPNVSLTQQVVYLMAGQSTIANGINDFAATVLFAANYGTGQIWQREMRTNDSLVKRDTNGNFLGIVNQKGDAWETAEGQVVKDPSGRTQATQFFSGLDRKGSEFSVGVDSLGRIVLEGTGNIFSDDPMASFTTLFAINYASKRVWSPEIVNLKGQLLSTEVLVERDFDGNFIGVQNQEGETGSGTSISGYARNQIMTESARAFVVTNRDGKSESVAVDGNGRIVLYGMGDIAASNKLFATDPKAAISAFTLLWAANYRQGKIWEANANNVNYMREYTRDSSGNFVPGRILDQSGTEIKVGYRQVNLGAGPEKAGDFEVYRFLDQDGNELPSGLLDPQEMRNMISAANLKISGPNVFGDALNVLLVKDETVYFATDNTKNSELLTGAAALIGQLSPADWTARNIFEKAYLPLAAKFGGDNKSNGSIQFFGLHDIRTVNGEKTDHTVNISGTLVKPSAYTTSSSGFYDFGSSVFSTVKIYETVKVGDSSYSFIATANGASLETFTRSQDLVATFQMEHSQELAKAATFTYANGQASATVSLNATNVNNSETHSYSGQYTVTFYHSGCGRLFSYSAFDTFGKVDAGLQSKDTYYGRLVTQYRAALSSNSILMGSFLLLQPVQLQTFYVKLMENMTTGPMGAELNKLKGLSGHQYQQGILNLDSYI
ncbi:MAG: hypothetical protein WCJ71_09070, partial [Candidatus Omnitrophota bacterium]